MARCDLDISNEKFRASIPNDPALNQGLEELRTKVAQDHKLSGWFNQPMQKFPEYQNKIWKWDFAPQGAHSSTRKSWRLYAYIPDNRAPEPIPAIPFLVYPRSENPKGNPAKYLAKVLKGFLARTVEIKTEAVRFCRQTDSEGHHISLCYKCWEMVCPPSADLGEIEIAENTHVCTNEPESN